MLAAALACTPRPCGDRKPTADGGGITIPIDAASCSIR
jgi:hypothetical protein